MTAAWEQFVAWLQQGQNAAAIQAIAALAVTIITLFYAFLTHRIMKSTGAQARAALQPALAMCRLVENPPDQHVDCILIENKGDRPVLFLDVAITCNVNHVKRIVETRQWDDHVLSPGQHTQLRFDFSRELAELHVQPGMASYWADIVVSDLSKQIVIAYQFWHSAGVAVARQGMPLKARWRRWRRHLGWRYYRIYYGMRAGWRSIKNRISTEESAKTLVNHLADNVTI